jgi:hypothetical protein
MSWSGEIRHEANGSSVTDHSTVDVANCAQLGAEAAPAQATATLKWPRLGGRYLRPVTIFAIDVERSDQRRRGGSTGHASSWNSR